MLDNAEAIAQAILDLDNQNTVEFNAACDANDALEEKIVLLQNRIDGDARVLENVRAIAVKLKTELEKAAGHASELIQERSRNAELHTELQRLNKVNINLKAANVKKQIAHDALVARKTSVSSDENKLGRLTTVYHMGNDMLQIYPQRRNVNMQGKASEQIFLMYSNGNGCYLSGFLGADNQAVFSSFINDGHTFTDLQLSKVRDNTMSVPVSVRMFATKWLYRVNRVAKAKLKPTDLVCFKG